MDILREAELHYAASLAGYRNHPPDIDTPQEQIYKRPYFFIPTQAETFNY
ncbi:hypothetical protein GF357_04810 [Candidatus Dojkabacteria bacterium]|nr:hypothetical protein [Candidatus Dojkabacteria bacterium]